MVRGPRRGGRGGRKYGAIRRRRVMRPGAVPRRTVLAKKVHWFKELYQSTSIVGTGATISYGIQTFQLNELANASAFKAMFDLYKITGVKLKIVPRFNVSSSMEVNVNTQAGTLPMLYIAPNRDPYVPAPGSIGDILNDDGCKTFRLTRPITLYLRSPKARIVQTVGEATEDIPLQFNVGSKWQPWLTTGGNSQTIDQSGLNHYGFRWAVANVASADVVLDTYATLYFCCKEQD